ncbi:hypothetical protein [Murimonas intestini]|uniref:hypothetical protein n=1 Tax=Murimonas intestini TaxID=1337051 RepID=UPI00214AF8D4|nr:hypothetical protein [Murimonas intestini]MCR1838908.1 hypothetical protein [Murimonas intestini]MCR1864205.1 hypothetical protein [Murimonas intestini]MCR1881815.1 hypothetical protein [Murimonas intestini]
MRIETKRLNIIALTPEQLELWTNNIRELEEELLCLYKAEPMEGLFREIVCGQVEKAQKDPANYLWHTFCQAFGNWALKQEEVKHIISETCRNRRTLYHNKRVVKNCFSYRAESGFPLWE